MIAWSVGFREASWANNFMLDIADRLTDRIQLTTDGHKVFLRAVQNAFGNEVDYMQLIKIYGPDRSSPIRYSPPECIGVETHEISGTPERAHCSTSFVERANLTIPAYAGVQQENREPRALGCPELCSLQLLPDSPDVADHVSYGCWSYRSCLGD
jgi:hypothetical protein